MALLVGDKESPKQRRERLTKERRDFLDKRAVKREEERKQLVAEEKAASRKAYAEKRRGNRGGPRSTSKSPLLKLDRWCMIQVPKFTPSSATNFFGT